MKPVSSDEYSKAMDKAEVGAFGDLPIDEEGGLLIVPEAGFVFKTKEAQSETKFFINITSHPVVDKPEATEMVEMEVEKLSYSRINRLSEFQ